MKQRYRLFRRRHVYYSVDSTSGQQSSLKTRDKAEATRLLHAKNEAELQPGLKLQMARIYASLADSEAGARTWGQVMTTIAASKIGATSERWERAVADQAFESLRDQVVLETKPAQLFQALEAALGHGSRAVHRAYARKARVKVPTLEEYEKARQEGRIVAPSFSSIETAASRVV